MEELIQYQNNILRQINHKWSRYLLPALYHDQRMLGVKGLRGVGKSTMLLQYLKYHYPHPTKALYVTADHLYFYNHTLLEIAQEWSLTGGRLFIIDEVHKYPAWSRELKLIYDGFADLQIFFTSSSALDVYRGESDLSRRLVIQNLPGLSFREYLHYRHGLDFAPLSLEEIIQDHQRIASKITAGIKIIPLFKAYLRSGYFPFITKDEDPLANQKMTQIVNAILESDLATIQNYNAANVRKMKKLLGVIAESPPFIPNISSIAEKLGIGRKTVYDYIYELADALLIRNLQKQGKGVSRLQKPDKIYFENPTLAYAMSANPETGSVRETFFINQLQNGGHLVHLPPAGDFIVNDKWIFEIGGKNKKIKQVASLDIGFIAKDGIEIGFERHIPLWLFGFLY